MFGFPQRRGPISMKPEFFRLNEDWNAEPNAPDPAVRIVGADVVLSFFLNPFLYKDFQPEDRGILRFVDCERFRLGPTNDEGWYSGQCRFSGLAPSWGEFYLIRGDAALLETREDWRLLASPAKGGRHFLFYFRDNTFECVAAQCVLETSEENALFRTGKRLPQ
jgi:hypothetical protein